MDSISAPVKKGGRFTRATDFNPTLWSSKNARKPWITQTNIDQSWDLLDKDHI